MGIDKQRICPNPKDWHELYKRLLDFSQKNTCDPKEPPVPLILNGWVFTNDFVKMLRWDETIRWADSNNCSHLINFDELSFYETMEITNYDIGPMGGPMYQDWDFESKKRPLDQELDTYLSQLVSGWGDIAHDSIALVTKPLAFSGKKARNLIVEYSTDNNPPWGEWDELSPDRDERYHFTVFRRKVNEAITPHKVDHITFSKTGD